MSRGLWDGARALVFGISFIAGQRPLWRTAAVPALTAGVLGTVLGVAGAAGAFALVPRGGDRPMLWVLALIAMIIGFLLGVLVGVTLAVPLSGPALERIAVAVRRSLGVAEVPPPGGGWGATLSSLGATLWGLVVGATAVLSLTVVGLLLPPAVVVTLPLKAVVVGLLVTWDLGDHAFTRMGWTLRERRAWLRRNLRGAVAFGGLASLLLCIPIVGLLVLPMGVAGATWLIGGPDAGTDKGPGSGHEPPRQ